MTHKKIQLQLLIFWLCGPLANGVMALCQDKHALVNLANAAPNTVREAVLEVVQEAEVSGMVFLK